MKNTVKLLGIIVFALVSTGLVFAQEQTEADTETADAVRKNAITLDLFPLFKGFIASDTSTDSFFFGMSFAYERLLLPHVTVGGELDLIPGKFLDAGYFNFAIAATGRYYFMSEYMEKFFIGAHLGFNLQSVDGKVKSEDGGFAGLFAGLRAGYKLHFSILHLTDMFFVEPSIAYTYSKTSFDFVGMTPANYGWQIGLRAGVAF